MSPTLYEILEGVFINPSCIINLSTVQMKDGTTTLMFTVTQSGLNPTGNPQF